MNPVAETHSLSEIRLDPTLDRTHFDPINIQQLADNIKEHGLLNAISVRARDNGYEIIAGNRRYKAVQMLGWTQIDCRVYPLETTDAETDLLALIDNLERDDLNPIDQAKAYSRLRREHGLTQEEIAKQVGKEQSVIARTLSLLELAPEVQDFMARAHSCPVKVPNIAEGRRPEFWAACAL